MLALVVQIFFGEKLASVLNTLGEKKVRLWYWTADMAVMIRERLG